MLNPSRSFRIRFVATAVALSASVVLSACSATQAATPTTKKKTVATKSKNKAKPKPKPKKTVKRPPVTQPKATTAPAVTMQGTSVGVSAKEQVLKGYEAYFTAFVAAAREPGRAPELLPQGMTGDALTRMLEIRKLDAEEGLFWDGTRKDIVNGPRLDTVSDTTAVLRDCRSVGGVLRKKANNEVVPGTTDPDVDDFKVTLVFVKDKWLVTATERFNDVEGKSKCVPGSPSS
jgi:hypothetical protein